MTRSSAPAERSEGALPALKRFEIKRPLGQGGAGLVYEAIDRERGTRVALKMLRRLDADGLLRFKDEFRALQDIDHPNVIRLGELYQEGELWYFTMDLIDGESFLARSSFDRSTTQSAVAIERGLDVEPLAARDASAIVAKPAFTLDESYLRGALVQLAKGLASIHAAGVVHRDIKPSNVLVALDGRVIILDFGLATASGGDEAEGTFVGTPEYMAPEQAAGEELTPKADWYAVGVILYEALTGRPPFDGPALSVIHQKLTTDPPRPRDLVEGLPSDLEQLCVDLLQIDPEDRPDGAQVLRRLSAPLPSLLPSARKVAAGHGHFVGREREFASLAQAFSLVRRGGTAAVVLEADSGVGKTALVRRFVRRLPSVCADAVVLSGRCYEREDVPYKAIDGVMDAITRHLVPMEDADVAALLPRETWVLCQVFPVLGRVPEIAARNREPEGFDAQESRGQLFRDVRELFFRLAHARPLVVVIDDLQWADADSFALLRELLRPPLAPPLLLVATARPPTTAHEGSPYGLPGPVELLRLPRLTDAESLELATSLLGEYGDMALAHAIAKEAQGHPLFVDELVRHAQLGGGASLSNVHLDDALYARISRLEPGTREVVEMLAVAGAALPQERLKDALGISYGEFSNHVATLRSAHLARTAGFRSEDVIEPYHNRIREAVTARLDEAKTRKFHARLAEAYERSGTTDPEVLFSHWHGAGENDRAAQYAERAADGSVAAFAFDHATRFYERALELFAKEEDRRRVRPKYAEALANAGYGRRAAKVFQEIAGTAVGADAVVLLRRAGEELLACGALDEGYLAMGQALAKVGLRLPSHPLTALFWLLFYRAVVTLRLRKFTLRDVPPSALVVHDVCFGAGRALATVDTVTGSSLAARALALALSAGDASRIAIGIAGEAMSRSAQGGMDGRLASARLSDLAQAIAQETADPVTLGATKSTAGFAAFCQGRFSRALTESDGAVEILRRRCTGAFWYLRNAQQVGIWALSWMGELRDLAARVEARTREAEHRGDLYALCLLATGQPALAWIIDGDVDAARARSLDVLRRWTQRGYHDQHYWSTVSLMRLDLYEGKGVLAERRLAADWGRARRALMFEIKIIHTEALHLRGSACLAAAQETKGSVREGYLRWAAGAAEKLSGSGQPYARAFVNTLRAGVAWSRDDKARAARELRQAVLGFEDCSMSLHAELSRWQLGEILGGDSGRALTDQAKRWMDQRAIARQDRIRAMLLPGFRT